MSPKLFYQVMLIGKKQILYICLAIGCLLLGSALYILFRPTTLLMFSWADSLGLTKLIIALRAYASGFDRYLPEWIIFSLPYSLWVVSYLLFIEAIWNNSRSVIRNLWFWCVPAIAVIAELIQSFHIIPGYFDFIDLILIIVGTLIVYLTFNSNRLNNKGTTL